MKHISTLFAAAALAAVSLNPALAASGHEGMHDGMSQQAMPMGGQGMMGDQRPMAEGEGTVNSVNLEAGTINISHGPIRDFKWPPMTMDLVLEKPEVAEGVKAGDKVRLRLAKTGATSYVIVGIEVLEQ